MQHTRVRFRFSVEDYEQLIALGILSENDCVELIDGEILEKMAIGRNHAACVDRLNRLFNRLVGESAIVRCQNPVRLSDSEPEPDVALLRPRDDFYASGNPQASDVLLIIKVAEKSLDFDRDIKGPIYASNQIVEYWLVNLLDSSVEVYRQPTAEGSYGEMRICKPGERITLAALPDLAVAVEQMLT